VCCGSAGLIERRWVRENEPGRQRAVSGEVARNVSVGMPFVTTIEHLAKAGFHCTAAGDAVGMLCSRVKFSMLLFSCVQRAVIATDIYRYSVVAVTAKPIACAGISACPC
jgi:hypothetical protein